MESDLKFSVKMPSIWCL